MRWKVDGSLMMEETRPPHLICCSFGELGTPRHHVLLDGMPYDAHDITSAVLSPKSTEPASHPAPRTKLHFQGCGESEMSLLRRKEASRERGTLCEPSDPLFEQASDVGEEGQGKLLRKEPSVVYGSGLGPDSRKPIAKSFSFRN